MKEKILVVEDLAFTRKTICTILRRNGYTVFEAEDAKTALVEFVQEHPKIVLLDLILPDRMDLSLLKEMKQENPDTTVIICSAMNQPSLMTRSEELGAKAFLSKPIDEEQLVTLLRSC